MNKNKLYKEIDIINNKEHILYLVVLSNDKEVFCKIGVTSTSLENRMIWINKYTHTKVYQIKGNGYEIRGLESVLKEKILNFNNHYQPKERMGGYTECYKIEYLKEILKGMKYISKKLKKETIDSKYFEIEKEKETLDNIFKNLTKKDYETIMNGEELPIDIFTIADISDEENFYYLISRKYNVPLCHFNDIFKYENNFK